MLAKSSPTVPGPDDKGGPFSYEPKWDGFRSIVTFDGENVELGSRGSKPLTRYFPDLVEVLKAQLPGPCVIDGEIVVRMGEPGGERLAWESLSQRIHPAESRVRKLAEETPASFIAFDLLEVGGESLLDTPFKERRAKLEKLLAKAKAPLHITQVTDDVELARRWLVEFEGAGLDGVVSKPVDAPYSPGKRTMVKTKHVRTADVVLMAYRIHKSGSGVGSLLRRPLQGRRPLDGRRRQRVHRREAPRADRRARAAGRAAARTASPRWARARRAASPAPRTCPT